MFHPVHTGRDRLGDAPRAMRVRGDRQPEATRGLTRGPQLDRAVLRLVHTEARRHQPTGRHDLDDVHPGSHPLRHRRSDTVHPVRRTTKKPAVPTRAGDRRPGHQQLRTPRPATAHATGEMTGVAQVTHRRDPRREGPRGIGPHPRQQNLVIHPEHVNQGMPGGLERQMHVRIHQPRQQRGISQLDNLGVRRRRSPGPVHRDYATVLDQHYHPPTCRLHSIEQSLRPQREQPHPSW